MNTNPRVIVVGGGIIGASCAYYLARAGARVTVLERHFFASGTSGACDGLILHWDKQSMAELALGQASAALWHELAEELPRDFEYRRRGSVVLAETDAARAALYDKAADLARAGVRSETLDEAGLHDLEPNLARDLAGGVFFVDDAQLDARLATQAFLQAAVRCGALLHQGPAGEVCKLQLARDGRVTGVVTLAATVEADAVVVAAGVWSGELLRQVGVDLAVRPRKGHVLVVSVRHAPDLLAHPLAEGGYAAAVGSSSEAVQVALIAEMTRNGTLLLGSSREFCGFDRKVQVEVVEAIAARAIRFIPALAQASVIRSYAGLRPWTRDHRPLIGPVDIHPGLYVATGHEGAGICLAPITGRMIADSIWEGVSWSTPPS